jgi:glycosyltransferase involved in cell wall biosynthesis
MHILSFPCKVICWAAGNALRFLLRYTWFRWLAGALRIVLHFNWLCRFGAWLLAGFPDVKIRLSLVMGAGAYSAAVKNMVSLPTAGASTGMRRRKGIQPELKDATKIEATRRQITPSKPSLAADQKRVIFYWIDHTVRFSMNTGIQRLTRCLARGLMEAETGLVFVCWNKEKKALVKATQFDLERLSFYNGPEFYRDFLASYSDVATSLAVLHEQVSVEELIGAWLIIPELTNIASQNSPPALDVIDYAKVYGMKTAFIFYDAIPLKLAEYADAARMQAEYMQHMTLADVIIPISRFSANDLVDFYENQLHFHAETMPVIKPVLLPGECYNTPRVTEYDSGEDGLLVLSVGTIEPRKNQVTLLKAFRNLCDRFPDAPLKLTLCGNLDPRVALALHEAIQRNPKKIEYFGYLDDQGLEEFYRGCSFTVFPSVEEGFGLPIVESLWHGKPVICANFGSMVEIAQGGGCLTIDVRSVAEMESALERMLFDKQLRHRLAQEAVSRPILSWREYATRVLAILQDFDNPLRRLDKIYYWVDHTCTYPANSGMQKVTRGLSRALQPTGVSLIPVKWDSVSQSFRSPEEKELSHLSRWDGSDPGNFSRFSLSGDEPKSWLLVPELTTYAGGPDLENVVRVAKSKGLQTAIVFYDALPYKLGQLYPPEATQAHVEYMKKLINFDLVFPISNTSFLDLQSFLLRYSDRLVDIEAKLISVPLPGEFYEHPRIKAYQEPGSVTIRILCVGTVEPRKNHLVLLESFDRIFPKTLIDIELVLVGGCPFPDLEQKINSFIAHNSRVHWLRDIDDTTLSNEYSRCHFTVYPSLEEGFGLPILESLWYGRPCICRNTGAMAEAAAGGGCLTVDTSDVAELADAMLRLVEDKELRTKLGEEAVARRLKTWSEYACEILHHLARNTDN